MPSSASLRKRGLGFRKRPLGSPVLGFPPPGCLSFGGARFLPRMPGYPVVPLIPLEGPGSLVPLVVNRVKRGWKFASWSHKSCLNEPTMEVCWFPNATGLGLGCHFLHSASPIGNTHGQMASSHYTFEEALDQRTREETLEHTFGRVCQGYHLGSFEGTAKGTEATVQVLLP